MAVPVPGIPKGTRDFLPQEAVRRNYIFRTIQEVFHLFGYQPIETPAMENLSTLLGKYGEEGDKLLFRILNSGDFLSGVPAGIPYDSSEWSRYICDRGLRYDLTVPFARFVVQHYNELVFPFKRYQMQPVWRADRPQKGRYREFYQCDADIIGSNSLLNELELVQMIDEVFRRLSLRVLIKLNNRKILAGIAETIGMADQLTPLTIALDKLEKTGEEKVLQELSAAGAGAEVIEKLIPFLRITGGNESRLEQLSEMIKASEEGRKGIAEMKELMGYVSSYAPEANVEFDITLARGLNYYTGTIVEVKSLDVSIGSICGGGRYDNLTGIFGLPGISGVGVSFGADRIYDVLQQTNRFPAGDTTACSVLFANFGGKAVQPALEFVRKLRSAGISSEIYPDNAKLKKQLDYANRRNIPYVVLAGEEELSEGKVTLKNMTTGEQKKVAVEELADVLRNR
ncbi:MAG: histidine--tRNA ligase [Bacteroidales bacterium]|nr:histidine--tRNA ligase [Bacteroidales bacterium]